MWCAAVVAIVLAFVGKFGASLQTIPVPVMGGILCLLFGSIAVVGLNTLIRHQVDLSQSRNLVIVGVTLVFGIGNMRSEEHTSELQSRPHLVCRLLLEIVNL